jgi:hypothetical protein
MDSRPSWTWVASIFDEGAKGPMIRWLTRNLKTPQRPFGRAMACVLVSGIAFSAPGAEALASSRRPAAADIKELRRDTQDLLDAIAPGEVAVWQRLLDPAFIQVDENDVVRDKAAVIAEFKPLAPGLAGSLAIDEFRPILIGDLAVVTHEDNEILNYHGQILRSRFRMTDPWHRTQAGWRQVASQILAVHQDPPVITLDEATLCGYAGQYSLTGEIVATIRCEGNKLVMERMGRPSRQFSPEVKDVFFEPGQPRTRRIFFRDASDQVQGFVDRREERDIRWNRVR